MVSRSSLLTIRLQVDLDFREKLSLAGSALGSDRSVFCRGSVHCDPGQELRDLNLYRRVSKSSFSVMWSIRCEGQKVRCERLKIGGGSLADKAHSALFNWLIMSR